LKKAFNANAPTDKNDNTTAENTSQHTETVEPKIQTSFGDCAYGSAQNRRAFEDAGRELHAKQASLNKQDGRYTKDDFPKDPQTQARTCPAGHRVEPRRRKVKYEGGRAEVNYYQWPTECCSSCPLRDDCLSTKKKGDASASGRSISEHPEEDLLFAARERQRDPAYREAYKERGRAEHVIARLIQLGARQARYFGLAKTAFQLTIICVVANLTKAAKASGAKSAIFLLELLSIALLLNRIVECRCETPWRLIQQR
jgi:hypothetical protein